MVSIAITEACNQVMNSQGVLSLDEPTMRTHWEHSAGSLFYPPLRKLLKWK